MGFRDEGVRDIGDRDEWVNEERNAPRVCESGRVHVSRLDGGRVNP